jgi:DNA-binding transcriptional ArsR family regulator
VEIEAGAAFELLLMLYTFYNPEEIDSYDVGAGWFEETRGTVTAALGEEAATAAATLGHLWVHLVGLALDVAPPREVQELLAHLDAMPAQTLRLHALGYYHGGGYHGVSAEVIRRAAEGDQAARDEYLRSMEEHAEVQAAVRFVLAQSPEETQRLVVRIVAEWYEAVFRAQEGAIMAVLQRDAGSKRKLIPLLSPEQLIERVTNGVQYTREAGIRRIVLVPSYILRPWVLISEHGDAKVVYYAVSEESLAPATDLSAARLSKLFKALADEKRLLILKRIAASRCTLQEIADDLGLSKSLVHHHVFTLRAAGLVGVSLGSDKQYALREDAVAGIADVLAAYLRPGGGAALPQTRRVARSRAPRRPSPVAEPRRVAPASERKGSADEP